MAIVETHWLVQVTPDPLTLLPSNASQNFKDNLSALNRPSSTIDHCSRDVCSILYGSIISLFRIYPAHFTELCQESHKGKALNAVTRISHIPPIKLVHTLAIAVQIVRAY